MGPLDGARVSVFSVFLSATAHGFNAVRAGAKVAIQYYFIQGKDFLDKGLLENFLTPNSNFNRSYDRPAQIF